MLLGGLFQEGFGLLSSTILYGRGAGHDVVSLKQVVADEFYALNRWNSIGLTTNGVRVDIFPYNFVDI